MEKKNYPSTSCELENTITACESCEIKNGFILELANRAILNTPFYPVLFNKIFPNFRVNILLKYPAASNKDIRFLSYLKLGFTTKDIAEYDFLSPKAVQMKKNRLRKKFIIPANEDLYKWVYQF